MMEQNNSKEFLLFALDQQGLKITEQTESRIVLQGDYCIELEQNNLYKLMQGGQVIAPFDDVKELCEFIKMDIALNE